MVDKFKVLEQVKVFAPIKLVQCIFITKCLTYLVLLLINYYTFLDFNKVTNFDIYYSKDF